MAEDWYLILGLSRGADEKAIRQKYKQLVKMYHPDRYGKDRIPFQKIQEAYSILGDTEKKRDYDAVLRKREKENTPKPKYKMRAGESGTLFTKEGIPVEPLASPGYQGSTAGNFSIHPKNSNRPIEPMGEDYEGYRKFPGLENRRFVHWSHDLFEMLRNMMKDF